MKLELLWHLLPGFWILAFGCTSPPPREGFTDIAISNSRQSLTPAPSGAKAARWDSLDLTMLDRTDVTLATLKGVTVSLSPDQDAEGKATCRVLFTASVSGTSWCTSPTYNQGLGQILELYFEKAGHALVLPWTMGAFKFDPGASPPALRFEKVFDPKLLGDVTEVEIKVQPELWKQCP